MSASDDARRLADRISELERALHTAECEVERLTKESEEQCDVVFAYQQQARAVGLSEQARNALSMAQRYLDEGDDIATSQRLQDALLQAVASATESKEVAA